MCYVSNLLTGVGPELRHRHMRWPPLSRSGVFTCRNVHDGSCVASESDGKFAVLDHERAWLESKGFAMPTRCRGCRDARKNAARGIAVYH